MTSTHEQPNIDGIRIHVSDRIATVTLDRPERRNALTIPGVARLLAAFDEFERDDDVWGVLLTGTGDSAFCSGIDLQELDSAKAESIVRSLPMGGVNRNLFELVASCSKPVVAALNGLAVGGGLELALAADLRVASSSAQFAMPEALRGMGANFGTQMLPRIVGRAHALELLYTGDFIDAAEALRIGLVGSVVEPRDVMPSAVALLSKIVQNAPLTVRRIKNAIVAGADLPLAAALRLPLAPDPYQSDDRREGVTAFLERREPNWSAR